MSRMARRCTPLTNPHSWRWLTSLCIVLWTFYFADCFSCNSAKKYQAMGMWVASFVYDSEITDININRGSVLQPSRDVFWVLFSGFLGAVPMSPSLLARIT